MLSKRGHAVGVNEYAFARRLNYAREDNLWFFFGGQHYLLPIDDLPARVAGTDIPVQFITKKISRSGAGNLVLVLDFYRDVGDGGTASLARRPRMSPTDRGRPRFSA
jgi:hypothetical protein